MSGPSSSAGHVHPQVTGPSALWLEPGAEAVRSCLGEAERVGALVTLDPNIRPAVLPDVGDVRHGFHELAAMADVVELSAEDAAYLYPTLGPADVVERIQECGVQVVALTDENRGNLIASGESRVVVRPPRVPVSDTIGAGDTYMGAQIHQLLSCGRVEAIKQGGDLAPEELSAICSFANQAAAITNARWKRRRRRTLLRGSRRAGAPPGCVGAAAYVEDVITR